MSSTSSVIAIANTPSLNASIRPVPQRSRTANRFYAGSAAPPLPAVLLRSAWVGYSVADR